MPKIIPIQIKESEQELRSLLLKTTKDRHRVRLKALLLIQTNQFKHYLPLANHLGYERRTVMEWMKTYEDQGLQGLLKINSGGSSSDYFTKEVHDAIGKRLSDPKGFFQSYIELHHWVQEQFGEEIKYKALYKYVRHHFKAKLKAPRKSHIEKDEGLVQTFKKTTPSAKRH